MLRFPKVNPRTRRVPADYADQLVDAMNQKLRRRKIKIDGSVSSDVQDGVVADVSTFNITESGAPVMSRNGFAMLVHVGEDPRAELFTNYKNDVDTVVPLTGYDAAFDAERIVNQSEHLLKDIREVAVKAARRNPNVPKAGSTFRVISHYAPTVGMGEYDHKMGLRFVVAPSGDAILITAAPKVPSKHKEDVIPAARLKQLFARGQCQGLNHSCTLTSPVVEE
jgi:hypothetical protein